MTDQASKNRIEWEDHDEQGEEYVQQSVCGRFEIHQDQIYGYYKLHRSEDTSESLGESGKLKHLHDLAERL